MVERDNGTIRAVAWSELFPWLSIVRSFRLAIAARMLVLGAVGILVTAICWAVVGATFGTDAAGTEWLKPFTSCPWKILTEAVPNKPAIADLVHPSYGDEFDFRIDRSVERGVPLGTDEILEGAPLASTGANVRVVEPLVIARD